MDEKSRRGPRFSLVSLVWMTLTASAVLLAVLSYRETQQLRTENQVLRVKLGALDIKDPTKVYARAVTTFDNHEWHWRLYVPRKHWYQLNIAFENIPVNDSASGCSSVYELEAGEYEIRAVAHKSAEGKCDITVIEPKRKSGVTIDEAKAKWITGDAFESSGVTNETVEFEPGKSIEFLRARQDMKTATGSQTDPNPCPGLLIWMQETTHPQPHTAPPPP